MQCDLALNLALLLQSSRVHPGPACYAFSLKLFNFGWFDSTHHLKSWWFTCLLFSWVRVWVFQSNLLVNDPRRNFHSDQYGWPTQKYCLDIQSGLNSSNLANRNLNDGLNECRWCWFKTCLILSTVLILHWQLSYVGLPVGVACDFNLQTVASLRFVWDGYW